jgi:L-alanine-DL-glutamate epimerase-like enolase superfamily enzyme
LVKVANLAEAHYVPVSPHCVYGPIASIAAGHAMLTVPNFSRQEFNVENLERYNEILDEELDVRDGKLYLPSRPGLGFDLREDVLERGSIVP